MKYLFIPLENNSSFSLSLPFYEIMSLRKYCKIKIEEIYKFNNFEFISFISNYPPNFRYLILTRINLTRKSNVLATTAVKGSGISSVSLAGEAEQKARATARNAGRKRYVLQIKKTIRRSELYMI